MPCRELRRATREEIARACFIRQIDVEAVADAWVDQHSRVELTLHNFTDRVTVPLYYDRETA